MLARLLPSKMVDSRRPGSSSMFATREAPDSPVLARWVSLAEFFSVRKAASALEKKAERYRQVTTTIRLTRYGSGIETAPMGGLGRYGL